MSEKFIIEALKNEILEDCKYLLDCCCNLDIAKGLQQKYKDLRADYMKLETCLGIKLALDCTEMLIALDRVIVHGDIISVSYDNDLVTILYADGFISHVFNLLAHYYSVLNPEVTFVDMEDPINDKGFRVLITHDEYIAFAFCCNCYSHIPENIRNLSNLILLTEDNLLSIVECPARYINKYGPYTDSEYHFTSAL